MDVKTELQIIAKVHRWAFEEVTFDLCMMEANRLGADYRQQFVFLKSRFGSGREVLRRAIEELNVLGIPSPEGTQKEQLQKVVRYYTWVLDTLTVEEKEKQAVELFSGVQKMYRFMLYELKTAFHIWETLTWLILIQSERRKTTFLFEN